MIALAPGFRLSLFHPHLFPVSPTFNPDLPNLHGSKAVPRVIFGVSNAKTMNEQRNTNDNKLRPSSGNMVVGLIILAAGVVFLLRNLDVDFFPHWLFRWPLVLIAIGLIIGVQSRFNNVAWLILVFIGGFFLLDQANVLYLRPYLWPVGIILIGLFLIFRSMTTSSPSPRWGSDRYNTATGSDASGEGQKTATGDDYIESVNVFGGTKRRILSKHFRGGQATNFFGGTDIDLTQADVDGTAVIEVVQVFGGVKLIVPANWYVKSDIVSIFGGVTDKRNLATTNGEPQRTVVLTGLCIFGGVDIKSY